MEDNPKDKSDRHNYVAAVKMREAARREILDAQQAAKSVAPLSPEDASKRLAVVKQAQNKFAKAFYAMHEFCEHFADEYLFDSREKEWPKVFNKLCQTTMRDVIRAYRSIFSKYNFWFEIKPKKPIFARKFMKDSIHLLMMLH